MEEQSRKIQRSTEDWENLPEEAINKIASNLKFYGMDHRSFRAVCRKWRQFTPSINYFLYDIFPLKVPPYCSFFRSTTLISSSTFLLIPSYEYSFPGDQSWMITVDEFDIGKLKVRHPITEKPHNINHYQFQKNLCLFECDLMLVNSGCKLRIENVNEEEDLCPLTSIFFIPDKVVAVLFINHRAGLALINTDSGRLRFPMDLDFQCDDIAIFKGLLFALSHSGDMFVIDIIRGGWFDKVRKPCSDVGGGDGRKRLVACNCEEEEEEMFMIVRKGCGFRVYKLNVELRNWERVYSFGGRILFVNYDKCFLVDADLFLECNGDCILFTENCFHSTFGDDYSAVDDELFQGLKEHLKLGVFYLDSDSCQLISSYPRLSEVFWPPPDWLEAASLHAMRFLSDSEIDFGSGTDSESGSEEQSDSDSSHHGKNGKGSKDHPPSSGEKDTTIEEVEENAKSVPALNSPCKFSESGAKENNDISLDVVSHISRLKQVGVESLLPTTLLNKVVKDGQTLEIFQGVDVNSVFVPILQKLWDKHGNIFEGHVVHSNGLLTWALESLAKITIILQSNSGKSLNDSQAEYLKSTLADLQHMHFKLDWLVPFVERALEIHKSKIQNP